MTSDPHNLSSAESVVTRSSELDLALQLINQVESIFNLDQFLNNDKDLSDTLMNYSADLLEQARYERTDYIGWVEKGCPSNCIA